MINGNMLVNKGFAGFECFGTEPASIEISMAKLKKHLNEADG